jgi:hypothetical protein
VLTTGSWPPPPASAPVDLHLCCSGVYNEANNETQPLLNTLFPFDTLSLSTRYSSKFFDSTIRIRTSHVSDTRTTRPTIPTCTTDEPDTRSRCLADPRHFFDVSQTLCLEFVSILFVSFLTVNDFMETIQILVSKEESIIFLERCIRGPQILQSPPHTCCMLQQSEGAASTSLVDWCPSFGHVDFAQIRLLLCMNVCMHAWHCFFSSLMPGPRGDVFLGAPTCSPTPLWTASPRLPALLLPTTGPWAQPFLTSTSQTISTVLLTEPRTLPPLLSSPPSRCP